MTAQTLDGAATLKTIKAELAQRVAVLKDPKCRSRYAALRARGHSYGRALRGVGDRLLGVACVLLQRGLLFDPDHGTPTAAAVRAIP